MQIAAFGRVSKYPKLPKAIDATQLASPSINIDAGDAGFISPEDVQKCIDGLEEAKAIPKYIESYEGEATTLIRSFNWGKHSYRTFWCDIDDQLEFYRKKNTTDEKEI